MKCILCGHRKGKRLCPATRGQICPRCCGEKRVVEIPCPEDCVYLEPNEVYHFTKKYATQLRGEPDPGRRWKLVEGTRELEGLVGTLEQSIIRHAAGLRTFQDTDVEEALQVLQATYRTEQKGILYEHSSSNPLVQALVRSLQQCLEELRSGGESELPAVRLPEILNCLELMEADVRFYRESPTAKGSYLTYISRKHPAVASEAGTQRLIRL